MYNRSIPNEIGKQIMDEIKLIVTMQVESDEEWNVFPFEDLQNAAKEAVDEALTHGSNRGFFNHSLADEVSIGVCSIDIVIPDEKHTVHIHWGNWRTRLETFDIDGEDCLFQYDFPSLKEANAFLWGLNASMEESHLDFEQVDDPEAYFEKMRKEIEE